MVFVLEMASRLRSRREPSVSPPLAGGAAGGSWDQAELGRDGGET